MKTEKIQGQKSRFEWILLTVTLLVALTGFAAVAGATYSLPAGRSVTWQGNVGVLNDIPARTTVYTTLSPSGGNDTSAIQAAITNCPAGQVVKLAVGTFTVSSPIKVKSGITLRGAGMGVTTLKGAAGMSGNYFIGYDGYSVGTSVNVSAGLAKGSTTITTATAHGWSVGDIILIDQVNNASDDPPVTNTGTKTATWTGRASGTRSLGQMSKVVATPTSTTATLEIPLYWNYDASLTPQATKINGITKDAGIEDLTVDNSFSGNSGQAGSGGTIKLAGASNSWILRVEGIGSWESMVKLRAAYRNTIRSCKFHEGVPALPTNGTQYATSRAYGIYLNPYASANLIENNQMYHLTIGALLSGAISGNVIAYNRVTELYLADTSFEAYTFTFHGAHPLMNLLEGNYTDSRLAADDVWGSSSHNTYFRNRHALAPNKTGGTWNFDIQYHAQYYNIIGNVIGTPGVEKSYELNNVVLSGQKSIYRFGYNGDGDGSASGNDQQVYSTLLRHGNWDSVTNGVVWNGSDDRVLPPSFYLSGKPSWWGSVQWPAIGPDVSPMYPAAGTAGSGTPWDSKTFLSPPSGLKVM